jgi:FixJ family two-component response regulator
LKMPDLSGLELQARLSRIAPMMPIVFLSGAGDISSSVQAMKAGALDFLEKPASKEALLNAVQGALSRGEAKRRESEKLHSLRGLFDRLSPREVQVFHLLVRGQLNKQIAFHLHTSERTIKAHRHNVMEKLGVRSLAEAASIAERLGLLDTLNRPGFAGDPNS